MLLRNRNPISMMLLSEPDSSNVKFPKLDPIRYRMLISNELNSIWCYLYSILKTVENATITISSMKMKLMRSRIMSYMDLIRMPKNLVRDK